MLRATYYLLMPPKPETRRILSHTQPQLPLCCTFLESEQDGSHGASPWLSGVSKALPLLALLTWDNTSDPTSRINDMIVDDYASVGATNLYLS